MLHEMYAVYALNDDICVNLDLNRQANYILTIYIHRIENSEIKERPKNSSYRYMKKKATRRDIVYVSIQ